MNNLQHPELHRFRKKIPIYIYTAKLEVDKMHTRGYILCTSLTQIFSRKPDYRLLQFFLALSQPPSKHPPPSLLHILIS